MNDPTVLVVDDDPLIRWALRDLLTQHKCVVLEADSGAEARTQARRDPDLVLLDIGLPDTDGLSLLRELERAHPGTPVIILTAHGSISTAVDAIHEGAYHYVVKPYQADELMRLVSRGLETSRLRRELRAIQAATAAPYGIDAIIGCSPAIRELKSLVRRIAGGPASTVLLTGETGTGKDLVAKVIHYNSARRAHPFVTITCSALPDHLLESELFGHERGAFTDAHTQKKGLFEVAHGGTVFLDEIGEMSTSLQAKLLRILEERSFKRIGGLQDVTVDVRVIAATHRDLQQAATEQAFREDLYYRLSVVPVRLPALREHPEDIEALARCFIDRFSLEFTKSIRSVSPDVFTLLRRHDWPGNVRELRNVLERAVLLLDGPYLEVEHVQLFTPAFTPEIVRLPGRGVRLDDLERSLVAQALRRTDGNQTLAAALLGLSRDQVRTRMARYGLRDHVVVTPPSSTQSETRAS